MEDQESQAAIRDAKQLEQIRLMQWLSESAANMNAEISASRAKLAARGLGGSPMGTAVEIQFIFARIESVIEKAISFRRELGAKIPTLLTPTELQELQDKLDHLVDNGIVSVRQRSGLQPRGGGKISGMQEAESRTRGLKVRIKQKLTALPLEARLGMHESQKTVTSTFNISNSTIANLNLGNVVGDLNSSIQHLYTSGRTDLAEGLRRLTEAIVASPVLRHEQRKELLEHLSVI